MISFAGFHELLMFAFANHSPFIEDNDQHFSLSPRAA
jgi:hypothetical protein